MDGVVELEEEVEDFGDKGFVVWNQRLGDVEVVVFELLAQLLPAGCRRSIVAGD